VSLKQVLKYLVRTSYLLSVATVGELIVVGSVIGFVTVFATAIGHSVLPFHCIHISGHVEESQSLRAAATYKNSNKIVSFVASRAPNKQKFKLLLFGMNCQCFV